jgi:very-short-patch-repair endonuclease
MDFHAEKFFNRKEQKEKRQYLRNNATRAEKLLWSHLQNRSLGGLKFRRQHGIGPYIVDFYCPEVSLVIELDGEVHDTDEAQAYDRVRDAFLRDHNILTLRFRNADVFRDIDSILQTILEKVKEKGKS